jgi:hypothetical protein
LVDGDTARPGPVLKDIEAKATTELVEVVTIEIRQLASATDVPHVPFPIVPAIMENVEVN